MGTRSLTAVEDRDGKQIIVMYRQYDGYPNGHGLELAQFLEGFAIVNGLGLDNPDVKIANGMGCLAAQIVAHFKNKPGEFYLYPPRTSDVGEEYTYEVKLKDDELQVTIREVVWNRDDGTDSYPVIFKGSIPEMVKFCEEAD